MSRGEAGADRLTVCIVDAAAFSLPYDHSLCGALHARGLDVVLARSRYQPGPWDNAPYATWLQFQRGTGNQQAPASLRGLWRARKGVDHALGMRRFVAAMAERRPSVIHFQWLPLPLVDGFALSPLRRFARLVLTLHDTTLFHGAPSSRLQSLGLDRAIAKFDRLIVHTEYSRRRAVESGLTSPNRILVVPHGPFSHYRRTEPTGVRDESKLRLLFFGSIKPYKGLDLLIDALGHLPVDLRRRVRLVIAGEPSMSIEPLIRLAERRGVRPLIQWRTEYIKEESVAELFAATDVVVLPYREIDQSGVLLTAAAFGKPVVATRVGGIPEILGDGERGVLAGNVDAESIARALTTILERPDLGRPLGQALQSWCDEHHSWATAAKLTEALYRSLVVHNAPTQLR